MSTRYLFLCIFTWGLSLFLSAGTAACAEQSANTEKLQNARKLILLLGGLDTEKPGENDHTGTSDKHAPQLGSESGETLTKEVDEKDLQRLIDELVPVYDKYLTDEEVSELLKFYETATGKRVAQAMPQMRAESRRIIQEWKRNFGKTVEDKRDGLIRAVAAGDAAAVHELLSKGGDVNERNSRGITPLMAAAYKGDMKMAQLLAENGADVNARTDKGGTPLMAAVQ